MNNPRYQIVLESANNNNYLLIILKGPKQYQIGFDINTVVLNESNASTAFKTKSSGPFRFVFSLISVHKSYSVYIFIKSSRFIYLYFCLLVQVWIRIFGTGRCTGRNIPNYSFNVYIRSRGTILPDLQIFL